MKMEEVELIQKQIENLQEQIKLVNQMVVDSHSSMERLIDIIAEGTKKGDVMLATAIEECFKKIALVEKLVAEHGHEKASEIGLKGLAEEALGKYDEREL